MFQRKRYQFGWLRRKPRRRGPDVWVWVHRSKGPAGTSKENAVIVGNVAQYPTEAEAWRATEGLRLAINTTHRTEGVTFNAVIVATCEKSCLSGILRQASTVPG